MNYVAMIMSTYKGPEDLELVLRTLRESGADQIESVKLLLDVLKLPLRTADQMVLCSETWKDKRDETERLRDALWDALEDRSDEGR